MEKLNPKEQKVYDYIVQSIKKNGYAPSVRDICHDLEYKSTSTVHMYINRLEMFGYLSKEDGKSRAVKLANDSNVLAVPIVDTVTAGVPILTSEQFDSYVGCVGNYPTNELFALKIKGNSMVEAGILDKDIIVARKTCYAENGEIVVALIDNEATVKRFFRENGQYRLQPENSELGPIILDEVLIIGKVISVQRYYE